MIARLRRPRDVSSVEGILSILGLANPSSPLSLSLSFPLRLTSVSTRPCLKPDIELGEGFERRIF